MKHVRRFGGRAQLAVAGAPFPPFLLISIDLRLLRKPAGRKLGLSMPEREGAVTKIRSARSLKFTRCESCCWRKTTPNKVMPFGSCDVASDYY